MQKIERITGSGVPLLLDDIDTDRIIPARYLRCVTFDGLGEHLFEDDRQQDAEHPLDDDRFTGGSVLISGRNFGCGSSREHAPQALLRWGIKAIIAESFAEIFFGNCTSLGVVAVCLSRDGLEKLTAAVKADPTLEITIDLNEKTVCFGEQSLSCEMAESARTALVTGEFDFLAQLIDGQELSRKTAEGLPYMNNFV